jgi:hypothetical protein
MRRGLTIAVTLMGMLSAASPAGATFHLMKIQEVGQGGAGVSDYVVLQMYAGGQSQVGGKLIQTYDSTGAVQDTFTFPSNVAQADSQRTIYVARDDGTPLGMPDFVSPNLVLTNVGAVCFGAGFSANAAIDCVSYGAFPGFIGPAPSPTGAPAPEMGPGQAIRRTTAPGCATLLEDGDDTNDSATDFSLVTPAPRNNQTPPTETSCGGGGGSPPNTTISKHPKKKTPKTTAKFKFRSDVPGSTFECKLDREPFDACKAKAKFRHLDRGRHKLKVRAVHDGVADPSPAKYKWKVVD